MFPSLVKNNVNAYLSAYYMFPGFYYSPAYSWKKSLLSFVLEIG
jgi:hypothetical protein